jgi:hypothetical protein
MAEQVPNGNVLEEDRYTEPGVQWCDRCGDDAEGDGGLTRCQTCGALTCGECSRSTYRECTDCVRAHPKDCPCVPCTYIREH